MHNTITTIPSPYPKQGLVGVQTVAKFRDLNAPFLPVRIYLANIRWVMAVCKECRMWATRRSTVPCMMTTDEKRHVI